MTREAITMGTLNLQSGNPWVVLDAGLWFVFVVWAIALHLCRDEPQNRHDPWERSDAW
jgi:hypothetical protein